MRKIKTMTKFVITSYVLIIVFTIVCFVAVFLEKPLSDTLIISFYSTFAGELIGLLVKKIFGMKKENGNGKNDISEL